MKLKSILKKKLVKVQQANIRILCLQRKIMQMEVHLINY